MPTVPKQIKCQHLGCTNDRSPLNTYCMEHGGKGYNDTIKRKQFNAMYQTAQWSRVRARQLSTNPLCQACVHEGKVSQATEVDHVFPWQRTGEAGFYFNIFQSLCKNHHTVKTGLEQRGICRHYATTIVDYTMEDYQSVAYAHASNQPLPLP